MTVISEKFLARIESLGDNCEFGFVMRNLKYEKGGLFRWTIAHADKLIEFVENPNQLLYQESDLTPFSPGMVIDNRTGFSFHSKMKSERDSDGELRYTVNESERVEIYAKEKSKLDYLRQGFVDRLESDKGSVYFLKANKGIAEVDVLKLVAILNSYSPKHVLVEVRCGPSEELHEVLRDCGSHFVANISRFAPYIKANDVLYDEWNSILAAVESNKKIAEIIG